MFQGLSTLRGNEVKASVGLTDQQKAMQAYLHKYSAGDKPADGPSKKKRKKVKASSAANGIRIVDQDSTGFGVSAAVESDDEGKCMSQTAFMSMLFPKGSADQDYSWCCAEAPVIANPIEAAKAQEQAEKVG